MFVLGKDSAVIYHCLFHNFEFKVILGNSLPTTQFNPIHSSVLFGLGQAKIRGKLNLNEWFCFAIVGFYQCYHIVQSINDFGKSSRPFNVHVTHVEINPKETCDFLVFFPSISVIRYQLFFFQNIPIARLCLVCVTFVNVSELLKGTIYE